MYQGNNYLNFFKIKNIPVVCANKANLSLVELASLVLEKNFGFLSNVSRAKFSKPVTIKAVETREISEFPYIIAIVKHFKSLDIIMNRNNIAKILNIGESYNDYIFQK